MEFTKNYQLRKPGDADNVLVEDLNFNMDTLDEKIPEAIAEVLKSYPKIATGEYTGTGSYGSTSPNKLTFPFKPKLVVIMASAGGDNPPATAVFVNNSRFYIVYAAGGTNLYNGNISWSANSVSWYYTGKATIGQSAQYNVDRKKYYWVAFG